MARRKTKAEREAALMIEAGFPLGLLATKKKKVALSLAKEAVKASELLDTCGCMKRAKVLASLKR